jgi:hypothetical protein
VARLVVILGVFRRLSSVSHRGKDGDGRFSRWAESDNADGPTGLGASRGDVDGVRSIKQSGLSERGRRGERAPDCFARASRVSRFRLWRLAGRTPAHASPNPCTIVRGSVRTCTRGAFFIFHLPCGIALWSC